MAHERGGRQHVHLGRAHPVVPEVVHVAGEDRFHRRPPDLAEQPGAGGLVDVVVVAGLVGAVDVGRIVHEQEHAPVPGGIDLPLGPRPLPRLCGEPGVQEQGVQHDEAHAALVEGVEVRPERFPVGCEVFVADLVGGHPVDGLVPDVVVAGNDVQGHGEPGGDRLEAGHRLVERGQRRDGVHDVPEVHDEARGRAHGRNLGEHVAGAGVGEMVGPVGRGRGVLVLVHVGVGHDDEGEQRMTARCAGGLPAGGVGHGISR